MQGRNPGSPDKGRQRQLRPQFQEDFGCDRLATHVGPFSVLHGRNQPRKPKPATRLAPPRLGLPSLGLPSLGLPSLGLPFWPHRLPRSLCRTAGDNSRPVRLFRSYPRKYPGRCDPLHISLVGLGLDRRHEQRDPNLIRRAGRPPHRLRPDRHRRWGGPGCAGLPPAGLKPGGTRRSCVISRAFSISLRASRLGSRISGFFRSAAVAASGPGEFRKNQSSAARAAAANHPPL